ncbi:MAG: class I SAM-dependent methyltransferase [Phycisphaeraceae bacterium]|nr:class I SAM-dependent methyltransferase [Phycisphaeraceae bacterium]
MGGITDNRDSLQAEARTFDAIVREKGDFNPFADRGWETLRRRFEAMIPAEAAAFGLLDVGCGSGQSRRVYRAAAAKYVGLDLSEASVRRARELDSRQHWLRGDALALPLADASFGVVAFSSVLHHVPDRQAALREAVRVLRPGGWVFAFDPNLLHPAMAMFRHPRSPFYLKAGVSPDEQPLLPSVLRRELAGAGLIDIRQRCQSDIPYRDVAPRLIRACLGIYNRADWMMEKTGLARWFGTFVVTVGRKPAMA